MRPVTLRTGISLWIFSVLLRMSIANERRKTYEAGLPVCGLLQLQCRFADDAKAGLIRFHNTFSSGLLVVDV